MNNTNGWRPNRRRQRGVSLFVVLVMVLLTTLMTLWAARTAMFNELIAGNDADYQRAVEAAQAMVRDAELDIMGIRPDGQPCTTTPGALCRPTSTINVVTSQASFPAFHDKGEQMDDLTTALAGITPSCVAAICTSANFAPEFWRATNWLTSAMRQAGARYGQFTGANPTVLGNPLLLSTSPDDASAFYWVEPIPYRAIGCKGPTHTFAPSGGSASCSVRGVVYRVTAVALGRKAGTQAVIQTVLVIKPAV